MAVASTANSYYARFSVGMYLATFPRLHSKFQTTLPKTISHMVYLCHQLLMGFLRYFLK